jgi:hypothetical protein
MTRARLITLLVALSLVALVSWVASHTYWGDISIPAPPKGEALTNPFYAVQRFAEALGARTAWRRTLATPSSDSVIVVSAWHWNLTAGRREAFEQWVESGGRLVVDRTLAGGEDEFERWSGIVRQRLKADGAAEFVDTESQTCRRFEETRTGAASGAPPEKPLICDVDDTSSLSSNRPVVWSLHDGSAIQAMRVEVGRGSVSVINATPFRERSLFDGDHGWLFAAATELRRGDTVIFLSEDAYPSLLALLWRHAAPVVILFLTLIALVMWRDGVRFGPLAAVPEAARRSLVEQIRGTGQFILRHGGGGPLHAAAVRALDEAAARRVSIYASLSLDERAAALARLTGLDRDVLAAAVRPIGLRRFHDLRNTIALLEAARRRTLIEHTRFSHGTD